MFEGTAENFLFIVFGAFMLGWMVAKFGVWVSNRFQKVTRDPRDDRIRSLEADHRVAKTDSTRAIDENETLKQEFKAAQNTIKEFEKRRDTRPFVQFYDQVFENEELVSKISFECERRTASISKQPGTTEQRLKNLKELYDGGVITQSEYDLKRSEILSEL